MHYRREIDGLRAIAVLPVILFHGGFEIFSGGFVGVDVFFVISGYLITGIIISELDRGTFSIARFYERRARRILPALFFVILACLPFAWAWMPPSQFEDFGKSINRRQPVRLQHPVLASERLFRAVRGRGAAAAYLEPRGRGAVLRALPAAPAAGLALRSQARVLDHRRDRGREPAAQRMGIALRARSEFLPRTGPRVGAACGVAVRLRQDRSGAGLPPAAGRPGARIDRPCHLDVRLLDPVSLALCAGPGGRHGADHPVRHGDPGRRAAIPPAPGGHRADQLQRLSVASAAVRLRPYPHAARAAIGGPDAGPGRPVPGPGLWLVALHRAALSPAKRRPAARSAGGARRIGPGTCPVPRGRYGHRSARRVSRGAEQPAPTGSLQHRNPEPLSAPLPHGRRRLSASG